MPTKKSQKDSSNLGLALFFVASLVFIVIFSFVIKTVLVYNQNKFDGKTPLSVLAKGENTSVISFLPVQKSISIIILEGDKTEEEAETLLGLTVSANIESEKLLFTKNPESEISDVLLDYKTTKTDLTVFDRLRLFLFVKSFENKDLKMEDISDADSFSEIDKSVSPLFTDEKIIAEGLSIEVVNATGLNGAGSSVARMVSNMGGNVILVSTSRKSLDESSVEYKYGDSYTASRLSEVLGYSLRKHTGGSIADVIIVVGKVGKE